MATGTYIVIAILAAADGKRSIVFSWLVGVKSSE